MKAGLMPKHEFQSETNAAILALANRIEKGEET